MDILDFCRSYLLRLFFAIIFPFFKIEIIGSENIPKDKGFIWVGNHSNLLDGPLATRALWPRGIYWVVSKSVYSTWYFKPILAIAKAIPVNGSMKKVIELLEDNNVIGIFPQGTLSCERVIKKCHNGVAILARKTGVPVLPCYIKAVIDPKKRPNITPKPFTSIKVIFGKPLYFEKCLSEEIPADILDETLSKTVSSINALSDSQ